jgi:hypothetical protein
MQGQATVTATQTRASAGAATLPFPKPNNAPVSGRRSSVWTDIGSISLLIVLVLSLRLYLVWHTEVAARDSIGYIRYAWQLKNQPWLEVLRQTEQPPLYAVGVLAMSIPVDRWMGAPQSIGFQRSAQLASVLASMLLVIPMFLLGKELFDRSIAFWAVLLFQALPATGRFFSDGLSEATFLLFVVWCLWFAARGLRTHSILSFSLAGACGGLAYLTRPEGAVVVVVVALVLVGCQLVRGWRMSVTRWAACLAGLSLGAALVGGPYVAAIGRLTNKQSHRSWIEGQIVEEPILSPLAAPLAVWWSDQDASKSMWALRALGTELSRGAFHVGWLAAIIGLWSFRHRLRTTAGAWLLVLLALVMGVVLWRLAYVMGYLSDRHCLLILLCAMYWMAAGFKVVGAWLSDRVQPHFGEWTSARGFVRQLIELRLTSARALAALLTLALIGVALPKSLETLHCNRAGFRQAGLWLFENADPTDKIVDPYCWSHYYAGRVFREGLPDDPPPGHQRKCYVILEQGKSDHQRLTSLEKARELAAKGQPVFRWSGRRGNHDGEVVIYAVTDLSR